MSAIWAEVVGTDLVGVDDDFFALGGHSLQVVEMLGRIYDEFGVELSLASMFLDALTVAELARHIDLAVIEQAASADVAAVLQAVGEMSDEDVTTMLKNIQ